MNIIEQGLREKVRFDYKGQCSTEDLYDLSPEKLDAIYKDLRRIQKEQIEESLLSDKNPGKSIIDLKVEIVKHIFQLKYQEREEAKNRKEKQEKKQKILSIIAEKQDADLKNKSIEELTAFVNSL